MSDRLQKLQSQQADVSHERAQSESAAQRASQGMAQGVALRRLIAKFQASIYLEDSKYRELQGQESRLQQEHDEVAMKLQAVLDPRIAATERRVHEGERVAEKSEEESKHWAGLKEKYHTVALQSLEERKASVQSLQDAEAALRKAEQAEQAAVKAFQLAKAKASQAVEAYRYTVAKYEAAKSDAKAKQGEAKEEKVSLDKLHTIFTIEKRRLDAAMEASHRQLQKRIQEVEGARAGAAARLEEAKAKFLAWQEAQRGLARQAASQKQAYEGKAQTFSAERAKVLAAASDQAGQRALSQSDWAWSDWAWGGSGVPGPDGEDVEDVSLS